jgi:hypothetical protein
MGQFDTILIPANLMQHYTFPANILFTVRIPQGVSDMFHPFRYSLFQALLLYVIVPLVAALALVSYLSLAAIEDRVEKKMQDNALQAVDPGQGRVRLEWECTSTHCIFRIQDNGPGIPPDLVTQICDLFFSTKPVGEGTGLGLAVVHGIVEEHQGSLHIDTSPLGGAEFRVVFPRQRA